MTFSKTARRGDTIESLDEAHQTFRSKKEFWLGPFVLLRPGNYFYFDRKCRWVDHKGVWQDGRVVVMPCGYSEIDDVELAQSMEGLQKLLDDAWIEEVDRDGNPFVRTSKWERLTKDEPKASRWSRILDFLR